MMGGDAVDLIKTPGNRPEASKHAEDFPAKFDKDFMDLPRDDKIQQCEGGDTRFPTIMANSTGYWRERRRGNITVQYLLYSSKKTLDF